MRRRTLALVVAGAATMVTLTACGSTTTSLGEITLSASEQLVDSSNKVQQVGSYKTDVVADLTHPREGSGTLTGSVVYQQKPDLKVDLKVDSASFGGQKLPGGVRLIVLGDTAYADIEALRQVTGLTKGKPWIKVPLNGDAGPAKEVLDRLQQIDLLTVTKMITSSRDAKVVGEETVGGVATRHYSGTFPVDEALKLVAPERREATGLKGLENVTFDMYVDGEGLPRKLVLKGAHADAKLDLTLLFSGFNEPVEIAAPPANEVGDAKDLVPGPSS
ncbi:DUF1396 domain-containing protein [Rhizohabitans arisaemae]|uniref:DUF1396 domain-containing protein n=1 Tax=Rhizohabitans arisaemae TaxID=2720610 RepID=UPI0024B09667|nr:DUF1396 domain-containing protein [Rhizohabitans arisaemae]